MIVMHVFFENKNNLNIQVKSLDISDSFYVIALVYIYCMHEEYTHMYI
jgi:hypothetical protein